jgi:hypothetical protein
VCSNPKRLFPAKYFAVDSDAAESKAIIVDILSVCIGLYWILGTEYQCRRGLPLLPVIDLDLLLEGKWWRGVRN